MKLYNIRLGFACNSSSTHSIVVLPEGVELSDTASDRHFGWDHWTATNPEVKQDYARLILKETLKRLIPYKLRNPRGVNPPWSISIDVGLTPEVKDKGYIDHQSILNLPSDHKGVPHRGFYQALSDFLAHPSVAILGGNDNDDSAHPDLNCCEEVYLPINQDSPLDPRIARYDSRGQYWVLFDRQTGDKIRFSFNELLGGNIPNPSLAEVPELIDIKITDHCQEGCLYCYQGSTGQGRHADRYQLHRLAGMLAELEVFEVALGGGEPMDHPEIVQIVHSFRDKGIIPNVTTRSLDWFDKADELLPSLGAIAYSVDSAIQLVGALQLLDKRGLYSGYSRLRHNTQLSFQHVLGCSSLRSLDRIVRECLDRNIRLVLLGWKSTGRGSEGPICSVEGWTQLESVQTLAAKRLLGVDTAVLQDHDISALGAIPQSLHAREGTHSMYIDMVDGKVGPSSYCDEYVKIPTCHNLFNYDAAWIRSRFQGWQEHP